MARRRISLNEHFSKRSLLLGLALPMANLGRSNVPAGARVKPVRTWHTCRRRQSVSIDLPNLYVAHSLGGYHVFSSNFIWGIFTQFL